MKITTYPDIVLIKPTLEAYNGIKMKIKQDKSYPEFDTALKKCINQ